MKASLHDIKNLVILADYNIKQRTRYSCGLERLILGKDKDGVEMYSSFFSSPDGQNAELYGELRSLGMLNGGFSCVYQWKVTKCGYIVSYTEGDIVIYEIKKLTCPVCNKQWVNGTCAECDKMVASL